MSDQPTPNHIPPLLTPNPFLAREIGMSTGSRLGPELRMTGVQHQPT